MLIGAAPDVVGRDDELAAIARFLGEGPSPAAALVLEGEAGIGKTTLWLNATEQAAALSYLVLAARPAQADEQLSFAGLADLLAGVLDRALAELPAPQRSALEVALLLVERPDPAPDPSTIAFAFLNVLRGLARETPIALAIDDVQWLDPPSRELVRFAAPRLREEPVRLLVARRDVGRGQAPLELERALPHRVVRLSVGPLSLGALHALLRSQLGVSFARPTLRRLHEASGGNPLYALEIGRALNELGGRIDPSRPLPIPAAFEDLLGDRLRRLPDATQEALLVVAVSSEATLGLLEAVLARPPRLQPAIDARVIEVNRDRVRFTHPLYAATVKQHAGEEPTRRLHLALAEHASSGEERALHLALGASGVDERAAQELVGAGRAARGRGTPIAAAAFFDHALRLSPASHPERARRETELARSLFEGGDTQRAAEILERLRAQLPPGHARAAVLWRLALVNKARSVPPTALLELVHEALRDARGDPALEAAMHCEAAWARFLVNDLAGALEHARAAAQIAESVDDAEIAAQALDAQASIELWAGVPSRPELMERALALEREAGHVFIEDSPSLDYGWQLCMIRELARARPHLKNAERLAREHGDEAGLAVVCGTLTTLETLAGNWELAMTYAREANELAQQTGVSWHDSLYPKALLEVHLGHVEYAEQAARELVAAAERNGPLIYLNRSLSVLGFLELSRGEMDAARDALERATEAAKTIGIGEPGFLRCVPDLVEALAALGQLDEAQRLTDRFDQQATSLRRGWAIATADRCRGLILMAGEDAAAAVAVLERARAGHSESELPFELGRTLLALGTAQRRARQRRSARESLQQSLEIFERLGAPLWAGKARAELGRIAGRTPAGQALTATEERIAELVARGLTNREVASELVLAVHSVESALTRIYGKLGVRSRTELARHLAKTQDGRGVSGALQD